MYYGVFRRVAARCSKLPCVAVCCSVAAAAAYVECVCAAVAAPVQN